MAMICDDKGNHLGDLVLSDKQRALLEAGQEVTISYHTPLLMRGLIGRRTGQITIKQQGKQIVANNARDFGVFMALREAINAMQKMQQRETE